MRIVLDRALSLISYYVDDEKIGEVKYEGDIPQITKLQMDVETPLKGTTLQVAYDNLKVKSWGKPNSFGQMR